MRVTEDLSFNLLCGSRGPPSLYLCSSQASVKQALGQPGSRKELSDCSPLQDKTVVTLSTEFEVG